MKPNSDVRVAFITPSWERGWRSQPVFREFVRLFPHTVVFTGVWPGFTCGYEGSFEVRLLHGVRGIARDQRRAKGFTWISPRNLWTLLRYRPDVIFTNGFHLCAAYALLVKLALGTRVVLLWQGVSAETGGAPRSGRLWFRRWLARFFDLAISNTNDGINYLREVVGMPASKLWHEICEVGDRDSLCALQQTTAENPERPVFLFVGRTTRDKGLSALLHASSLLLQRGCRRFSITIVGDSDERLALQQLTHDLGLDGQVRWEGFVPYDGIGAHYQACDVFVLPSLEDTWGVAVPEAMLFAKPILCSKYAGSRELVQHGVNGFVFDPTEPEQLADYMSRFVQQPDLLPRLGAASAEIISHFTPRRTAQIFADAVRATAGKASGAMAVKPADNACSTILTR